MATAVFIRSESADYYLYCFTEDFTEEEALAAAEGLCYEDREQWCDTLVTQSGGL